MENNIIKNNLEEVRKELHNYTENLVLEELEKILNREESYRELCSRPKSLLDICTYTLNRLPAKYVASHRGEVYTKINEFEQQAKVDITSTLIKAIEVVSQNPPAQK